MNDPQTNLAVNDVFIVRRLITKIRLFFREEQAPPLPRLKETIGHRPFETTVNEYLHGYRKQYSSRDGRGAPWCSRFHSHFFVFCGRFLNRPYDDCVIFCRGHSRMTRGEPCGKRCLSCSPIDCENSIVFSRVVEDADPYRVSLKFMILGLPIDYENSIVLP